MAVRFVKYNVPQATIRNKIVTNPIELQFSFSYEIDTNPENVENAAKQTKAQLRIVINSSDGKDNPEQAEVYVNTIFDAYFEVSEGLGKDYIEKETLRLLFPYAHAYIAQLTVISQMPPLYIPPMDDQAAEPDAVDK